MSTQTFCIFLSYELSDRKDKNLFAKLCTHLSPLLREGCIKDVYDSGIGAGTDLETFVETYVNKADIIVLLISAGFFASDHCYIEMKRAIELSEAGKARLIPVLLRRTDLARPLEKYSSLPPGGKPVSEWTHTDEALTAVVKGIRKAIEELVSRVGIRWRVDRSQYPFYNVPYRPNQFFTGREDELRGLQRYFFSAEQPFQETRIQALSGLGGVGKTQLAAEYARRSKQKYQSVLWLNASSHNLNAELISLVDQLALSDAENMDEQRRISAIKRWLQYQDRWLLILDNLEDFGLIERLVPPQGGHVLLTVLSQIPRSDVQVVHLMPMQDDQGPLFLLRRTTVIGLQATLDEASEDDIALARSITEKLDGLPLALDQAGAYIVETSHDLARYLALYEREKTTLLGRRGRSAGTHPDSVRVTLSLAFEKVTQQCPAAQDLLYLFAFLHPDAIPVEVIEQGAEILDGPLQKLATDVVEQDEAITTLLDYSLVHYGSSRIMLSMHRMVQSMLRDRLTEEQQRQWAIQAVCLLNSIFPTAEFGNWSICEKYLSHAKRCADLIVDFCITQDEAARLLWLLACYCYQRAFYNDAERYLIHALRLHEQRTEANLSDIAEVLNILALVYGEQGRYQEGEALHQRVLEIREREQGTEHAETATALNNLALCFSKQGKYQEAEKLYQRVLAIEEVAVDTDPLNRAVTFNNLATLYYRQGKYQQAEIFYQRTLSIEENILDPDDPDLALSLNNLAALYEELGNYREARTLYKRSLSIRERSLGREHPAIAQSFNNLAGIYMIQGKYSEAKEYYQRALEIYEKIFASNHPEIGKVCMKLAALACRQRNAQEAEEFYQRALSNYERALGFEHPETAKALNGLGEVYLMQGRNESAASYIGQALAIRMKVLGAAHLDTVESQVLLAELFVRQKRYEQAEQLFQQCLAAYEQAGQRILDRVGVMERYARFLKRINRAKEAAALRRAARSLKTKHARALSGSENGE
jgi:tetratricopeptide (TPR) repeat protein